MTSAAKNRSPECHSGQRVHGALTPAGGHEGSVPQACPGCEGGHGLGCRRDGARQECAGGEESGQEQVERWRFQRTGSEL